MWLLYFGCLVLGSFGSRDLQDEKPFTLSTNRMESVSLSAPQAGPGHFGLSFVCCSISTTCPKALCWPSHSVSVCWQSGDLPTRMQLLARFVYALAWLMLPQMQRLASPSCRLWRVRGCLFAPRQADSCKLVQTRARIVPMRRASSCRLVPTRPDADQCVSMTAE